MNGEIRREILYDQECKVLSCALKLPELAFKMVEVLKPADFYDPRTKAISEAILSLVENGGTLSVDGVKRKLKNKSDLECLQKEIASIAPDVDEFDEFLDHIVEDSKLRQIESACLIAQSQVNSSDSDTLVGTLMQELITISMGVKNESFTPMEKLFDDTYAEIVARSDDGSVGFNSSLKSLNNLIGGFQAGKLYIIAGRPSMGKSCLAIQMASHLAFHEQTPSVFFSIEMPEQELMRRVMSNIADVEYWRIEKKYWGNEHLEKIKTVRNGLIKMPLFVNDSGSISVSQIIAKIKGLKVKNKNLGPVFIDYLQLMKIPIPRGSNRDIEIGETARAFKQLAKDVQIPVVCLSQVKRAVEEREGDKRPTLSDLRESGNLEQTADVVIFTYRDHYYTKDPLTEKDCEIIVAKNRSGRIGKTNVRVDLDYQKFSDIEGEI